MKLEGLIFDKDGTLFDFQATWARPVVDLINQLVSPKQLAAASEALGVDPLGVRFHPDSLVIASTTQEVAKALAPFTAMDIPEVVIALDRAGKEAIQVPAVPLAECLGELKRTHKLGVATNDSEAPARAHLKQENVLDLFDFVVGYDSGFGAKPEPGQLLAFAEAFDLRPSRVAMVGDSRHDLMAARAAGMLAVGVLTGVASSRDLADLADVILPDISHLSVWLADNMRT